MSAQDASRPRIIAVGANPAWQKVLHFADLRHGEVNRADRAEAFASGKGINFCRAAKVWGRADCRLVQFAGGENGRLLLADLEHGNMAHHSIPWASATRCCITCLGDADGSMTELIEPSQGPGLAAENAALAFLEEALTDADGMAICGQAPGGMATDFYAECVTRAAAAGVPVLIDAWKNIVPALAAGRKITLKINVEELRKLTDIHDPATAMRELCGRYQLERIAVTDGVRPAFLLERGALWQFTVPKVEKVVNPVGSGDTASAVFWSELLAGQSAENAFRAGLAAASANCCTLLCGSFDRALAERFYEMTTLSRRDPGATA